jgi:hypothetical protein
MFEHVVVLVAVIVAIGVVWDALMLGALAVLLWDAFPSGSLRAHERREPSGRSRRTAGSRSRPAGAAPARPARGAAA